MPIENDFQHSEYSRKDPGERVRYAELTPIAQPESPVWFEAMASLGTQLSQAGVRVVAFLHGSIIGTDLFGMQRLDDVGGLKRGYSRGISGLDALLAAMREDTNGLVGPHGLTPPLKDDDATKKLLDEQVGDAGNFTAGYVESFQKAINRKVSRPIVCTRELWSCEHHHLGRATAACVLLDRFRALATEQQLGMGDRILVQAHGQAGLVLALASNLLCPSPITGRKKLFELLTSYAKQAQDPKLAAVIQRIERPLVSGTLVNGASLDAVTYGTPVRYGWDPSGLGKLLHVINHRVLRTDGKKWLAKMELPQITMEMPIAWGGDYVQQLAVAGCDAVPKTEQAKAANKAIWELVEPWDGFERWLECARKSVRCPNDGDCLLVDYKDSTGSTNVRDHYYAHAAYTRLNAMLFNTSEIVKALCVSQNQA
jgi:hypothetical protein